MKKIFFALLLFSFGLIACETATSQSSHSQLDYSLYEKVLQTYVNEKGRVDYEGLKADIGDLQTFIAQVEQADISSFSETEKKAFWINAYNAITLKTVVDNYPAKTIRRINFGLVWNIGRNVAGGKKSLGDIEHKIVRPLGDPRIHFALNCASIGCPELPQKPFYPETLEEQLESEAHKFINNKQKVRLDRSQNVLYHSAILEWFEEDFLLVAPDIKSYLLKYLNDADKEYVLNNDVRLKTEKYDWGLNKQ